MSNYSLKRGRSPIREQQAQGAWSSANAAKNAIALPALITGVLTPEQLDAYQVVYRIEEITQKILSNDVMPPLRVSRSPSPPPQYDSHGKRTNTREQRYEKQLEDERHQLIDIAARIVPNYVAPTDYRRPKALVEKYFLPAKEHPEINFIGQLLGPRGNTLRKMQESTGARIAIRGKGSVKEGKNTRDDPRNAHLSEPLHCLITGDDEDKVAAGVAACKEVVNRAITAPEGQNDWKRGQLRELAALNGTLREDDDRPCSICGLRGHKRWECPNKQNYTQQVVCRLCGNTGHFARDCKLKGNATGFNVEQEFNNMLNDINARDEHRDKRRTTDAVPPPGLPMPTASGAIPPPSFGAPPGLNAPLMNAPPGLNAPLMNAPPGLSAPLMNAPPGLNAPPGMGAPPGLSAPPGMGAPSGLSAPPGMGAPPGIGAPPGLSAPPIPSLTPGMGAPPGLSGPPGLPGLSGLPGLTPSTSETKKEDTSTSASSPS